MTLATNRKYLRTIYQLTLQKKKVRQIDIALALGYARSSVSIMIKQLKKDGLISIENNDILLTFQGEKLAKESLVLYLQINSWLENHGILSCEAVDYADKIINNFDNKFIQILITK